VPAAKSGTLVADVIFVNQKLEDCGSEGAANFIQLFFITNPFFHEVF
jgi:hypothetical protein